MKTSLLIQSPRPFLLAALIASYTVPAGLAASSIPQQGTWSSLTSLSQGEEITVAVDKGRLQRGTFQSVTDDAITIHFATGDQIIARQSVTQVQAKRGGHRSKHVLIGLGIGAGAGVGLGVAAFRLQDAHFLDALPLGALVGAGVGALLPSGSGGWKTMYEVR